MASSQSSAEEETLALANQLGKTLKQGERLLAPTRRPDGTLRKPIRIRAGYVPQEEVAIYQSKGALWKKEMEAQVGRPPGFDDGEEGVRVKGKSKAGKRNERKKEKRLQAALEKAKGSEETINKGNEVKEQHDEDPCQKSESAESITNQISQMSISADSSDATPSMDSTQGESTGNSLLDIDKKIRALKKKIRLAEALLQKTSTKDMNPEQLDKVGKLEGWREELKLFEDKRAEISTA